MNLVQTLKIQKLHPDAKVPTYATDGSAAFDIYSLYDGQVTTGAPAELKTGLAFEIPEGHVMLVFSRSGHAFKSNVRLANCVAVIDADYRGELMIKLTNDKIGGLLRIEPGDRIAQAMIMPISHMKFEVVDQLSDTARGAGGLGSTGR